MIFQRFSKGFPRCFADVYKCSAAAQHMCV